MSNLDEMCGKVFLENQEQLFPKPVVDNLEEAMEFLEDCFAQVFESKDELIEYLEDEGVDYKDEEEDITEALEVFVLPDGRLMYVEA